MDFISTFLAERWFVIAAALVILFVVITVVKTVMKWVIVLALLAGLFFYGASYKDQLLELGSTVGAKVAEEAKAQAMSVITEEAKDAKYTVNPDGSYSVTTKSVKLDGRPGESSVQVTFMNQTFTWNLDDITRALIEQAKNNAGH
ncbi:MULTISPECIES: hypothetical protein [unclassified Paenibacillus]|uniref:hypothetical protein n=1 Tax=unclassified Paenibacillus TaxID=185978 RepID=UPI001AE9DFB3|nr:MULTISPECIES: hypothetical protein [unclassified Paenibacillus]MBP1154340.1 hypothetical protein [Paenibacillus sp. PvP091]MBP1170276.1 hypothetical protein [Paenibacillus sp. PvR098]MBP2441304.1 hypothetical protein [Paenibacillus sp. PvP052]